jgi:hypothetical protein
MRIYCIEYSRDFLELDLIRNASSGAKVLEISLATAPSFEEVILDKQKAIKLRDELTRLIKEME